MHELGITRNVVAIVGERAQGQKVLRVTLEVGRLSGMFPDAIRFCFDVCSKGTALEGAELQIVDVEGRGHCSACGAEPAMTAPLGRWHAHTHADGTTHSHGHDHAHDHRHHPVQALQVPGRGVLALNLMSSPGAGKTTLLERCIRDLQGQVSIGVVEGDQATANDAERIRAAGAAAVQVNTGTGCHLEADMLARALELLQPTAGSLVVIENVGNLVCPALFDLGEKARVVIFSVTEGEDKPLKYPHMFSRADVLLLSKTDLLPHLRVNLQLMIDNALQINPGLKIFPISTYSGEGLDAWYGWLRGELTALAAH